jgi:hypothetical protein
MLQTRRRERDLAAVEGASVREVASIHMNVGKNCAEREPRGFTPLIKCDTLTAVF